MTSWTRYWFFIVITQPFLRFEGVQKLISPKSSKFNANFQVWCKYLHFNSDMIYALRLKNENCSTCNQIAELRKWLYLKFVEGFQIYILLVDFIKALLTCKKSEETIVHRGQACTYRSSSTCQNDSNHHSWNYQKSKIIIIS